MSVWVIGLGLATMYLMKQNMTVQGRIEEAKAKFEGQEPQEAPTTMDGVTSAAVRKSITNSSDRFRDVNADLPKEDVSVIATMEDQLAQSIASFETAAEQMIRGVFLEPAHES